MSLADRDQHDRDRPRALRQSFEAWGSSARFVIARDGALVVFLDFQPTPGVDTMRVYINGNLNHNRTYR